jgi:hypothetical protein
MSFGRLATGQFRKVLWIPVSLHWHLRDCLVGEEGEFGGRGEEAGFDGVRGAGAELVGAEAGGRGQISVILGFAGVGWRAYTTQAV